MAFSHTITRSYKDSSGTSLGGTETVTADNENNVDCVIAATPTVTQVMWTCDQSALKSILLLSDKDVSIYINTDTSGTLIALTANVAKIWNAATDVAAQNPIDADVTSLYVHNAAASTCTLKIRSLVDVTPV